MAIIFIGLFLASCAPAGTYSIDQSRAIVVYGGVSYLHKDAQPTLSAILEHDAGSADGLAQKIRDMADNTRLAEFSPYPVVTSDEVLKDIIAQKHGLPRHTIGGNAIAQELAGPDVYVLTIIGSFEFDFDETRKSAGTQATVARNIFVTATALLSKANNSQIILSESATELYTYHSTERDQDRLSRVSAKYQDAASRAIELLANKSTWGLQLEDAKTMVTAVLPSSSDLHDLFGSQPVAYLASQTSCALPSPCVNQIGQDCKKLISFMAQRFTEALAERGEPMLPPWDWAAWGHEGKDEAGLNVASLSLSTHGSTGALDDQLRLVLKPSAATTRIVAAVADFSVNVEPHPRFRNMVQGLYQGSIDLFRFEGKNQCNGNAIVNAKRTQETIEVASTVNSNKNVHAQSSINMRQAWAIAAISGAINDQ